MKRAYLLRIHKVILLVLFISLFSVLLPYQIPEAFAEYSRIPVKLTMPSNAANLETTSFKVAAVLIEFSDIKHKVAPSAIKTRLTPVLDNYIQEASNGRARVTIDVTPDWILLPKNFSSYGKLLGWFPGSTDKARSDLLTDIVQFAAKQMNLAAYDGLIIIIPDAPFTAFATSTPTSAGGVVINWTTVQTESVRDVVFAHEFGHSLFYMPDLYDYMLNDLGEYSGIYF